MRTLEEILTGIDQRLASLHSDKPSRTGSRALLSGADLSLVEHVAKGGTIETVEPASSKALGLGSAKPRSGGLAAAFTKALAEGTGSAGGFLVERDVAEEIMGMLRARSAVLRLGPRIVPVRKELALHSVASGSTAYYVAENANIPISEPSFAENILLRPKELAALVPISNRLLRDASESPDVEQVLREDLAEVLSLRADLAFIQGSGGAEPLGIRNATGLTAAPSLGTNGGTPTFDNLKDSVANLRAANATFTRPGWLFHPRTINTLDKIKDGQGRYLAETGLLEFDSTGGGGRLLSFPFTTSTQIPTNVTTGTSADTSYIVFSSDWQEAWVGENVETLAIEASSEATYTTDGGTTWVSSFQSRQTLFRALAAHDFALRRPALFTVMTGVRP